MLRLLDRVRSPGNAEIRCNEGDALIKTVSLDELDAANRTIVNADMG